MRYIHSISATILRFSLLFLLIIGMGACTKEDKPYQSDVDREATVQISLDKTELRDGDLYSGEGLIRKVRILVFREGKNGLQVLDRQKLFLSGASEFHNPFTISAHAGQRHIYVIANEPDALTTQLDNVLFMSELEAIRMPEISQSVAQPFAMTGYTTATLDPASSVTANVSLTRIVAKITLDLRQETPANDQIQITKILLVRNAKNSRLLHGSTAGPTGFWDWTKDFNVGLANNATAPTDIIANGAPVYVYENIGSATDSSARATKLVVEALYNGIQTRYYAYVNDASTAADHHFSVHRNHYYQLTGVIQKIGEFSSLILSTTVLPWEVEEHQYDFLKPQLVSIVPANAVTTPQEITPSHAIAEFRVKIKGGTGNPSTRWDATLSNGLDFAFEGAHVGNADGITETTIRVKALKPHINKERKTDLYFTVDGQRVILNEGAGTQITEIKIVQSAI